jgi:hypothetical protein
MTKGKRLGGYLSLINATPYAWHNLYQHSYQLIGWKFPDVINPGKQIQKKKKGFTGN